ncbi:hypothetical protein CQ14_06570 [Bradyrhizobium lablabi]|uniref:Uncharacterized protein n=2 Tax=Bradyrhizobium lablabi TaxID=722472 RepID=A0A0R3MMP6_9BRAD|nr:hypothetical protein CQ14_06570 [Bradyrhizobium lablabi]
MATDMTTADRPKPAQSFDSNCYALAEHFLQDEPCCRDPELYQLYCHDLALAIQRFIEEWMFVQVEEKV